MARSTVAKLLAVWIATLFVLNCLPCNLIPTSFFFGRMASQSIYSHFVTLLILYNSFICPSVISFLLWRLLAYLLIFDTEAGPYPWLSLWSFLKLFQLCNNPFAMDSTVLHALFKMEENYVSMEWHNGTLYFVLSFPVVPGLCLISLPWALSSIFTFTPQWEWPAQRPQLCMRS